MNCVNEEAKKADRKMSSGKFGGKLLAGVLALCLIPAVPLGTYAVSSENSAAASVSLPKRFNFDGPAAEVIRQKPLHNGTVMQSFAFDNVNEHVYVLQLMSGGQQLPDESEPVSGAVRSANGDMTLTKLDLSGNKLGYMFLKGFGHGVQMGVETDGDSTYLWTETDSVTEGTSGWGTKIARFTFEDGKILTPDSPELEKFAPIPGADRTTVNIDMSDHLLTMRYRLKGEFRYAVYRLEDVKEHRYTPIADVPQPAVGTFQGFASYRGYLYLLEGTSYGSAGSVEPLGNTYITTVKLDTGEVVGKTLVLAGTSLPFREPEGMGLRIPDASKPNEVELNVGFASDFSPTRLANIFSVSRLPQQCN
ncbi:hypothetical protein [Paenibacillus sp. J2TS4]|uniref:phage baseplate protein n=1 Tax=Paenibacillus sp. J2TS4 TaxID=2807194 RepID=UPI001B1C75D5|nr:hypothetical protein [Paenibacillus sp. J2TS4]GIP34537.1 hypothetical protein J2TS4_37470 [Paenibacillus sp. J2TS4]